MSGVNDSHEIVRKITLSCEKSGKTIKEVLQEDLGAEQYVRWLTEFPDGDQFTIPSIGENTVRDYTENNAAVYDALDTGEFTFQITP